MLFGLQYLRAIAAIAVVVFHAGSRSGLNFHFGEAGVDLFFVLSGFLMVAITGPQARPLPFMTNRVRRIVPIYWIATSVVLLGALVGAFPAMRIEPGHVIASYLFVPWTSPSNGQVWPLLVPGWTLNLEMLFYLLFAALLPVAGQVRQVAILTALFVALVVVGILFRPSHALLTAYTDPILLEFAAGCWLGIGWKRTADWPGWLGWGTAALAAAAILIASVLLPHVSRAIIFGIPATIIVASVLALERRGAIGQHATPRFLGDASYSIYLWHTLAISVVLAVGNRLHLPPMVTVAAGIIGGVVAGVMAYLLLEKPLLRWFHARRYVRGVPVPGGV